MITPNRPPGTSASRNSRQSALQLPALVVHRDAHRLKQPGEVGRSGARPQHLADRVDEVVARSITAPAARRRTIGARQAHAPCGSSAPRRERRRPSWSADHAVQHVGRAGPVPGRHPHVERRTGPERESARRVVELWRGDAEIEQDAVGTERRNGRRGLRRAECRRGDRSRRSSPKHGRAPPQAPPGRGRSRARGSRRAQQRGVPATAGRAHRPRARRPPPRRARRRPGRGHDRKRSGARPGPRVRENDGPACSGQTEPDTSSRDAGSGGADGDRTRDLRCDRPAL